MSIMSFNHKKIIELITENYSIGKIKSIESLNNHSYARLYFIQSSEGTFIFKNDQKSDEVDLYYKFSNLANEMQVKQARVYKTNQNELLIKDWALYEKISGSPKIQPNPTEWDCATVNIAKYNHVLSKIDSPDWVKSLKNPWDRADSLDYLFGYFKDNIKQIIEDEENINFCINMLHELKPYRDDLLKSKKQLTHGDLGPGNILYDGNNITVIDFTPYYENHLYSF